MSVDLFPSGFLFILMVYTCGVEVFKLGLLYHGFPDAIQEGDEDVLFYIGRCSY